MMNKMVDFLVAIGVIGVVTTCLINMRWEYKCKETCGLDLVSACSDNRVACVSVDKVYVKEVK